MTTTIWSTLPLAFLIKASALLLIARLAVIALSRATAGARYLVWLAMLAMVLVLPVLLRYTPGKLEILPRELASAMPSSAPRPESPAVSPAPASSPSLVLPTPHDNGDALRTPSAPSVWRRASSIVAVIWAAVALALIGWLGAGALSVRRIVRGARTLDDAAWSAALCEVADRLELDATPRLVASADVEMPFACGLSSPIIVLPATAESWTDDRRRAVLFHELAHVRRRDLLGHALGRVVCALYWFHPLVWSAARQMRAESERACDDLVLACGARASEYADQLLDIVVNVRKHGAPAVALPMARRKEFEGRLIAILDAGIPRNGIGRGRSALLVGVVLALSLTIAAMTPAPEAHAAPRTVARDSAAAPAKQSAQIPETARRADLRFVPKSADTSKHIAIAPGTDTLPRTTVMQTATSFARQMSIEKHTSMSKTPNDPNAIDPERVAMLLRVLRSDSSATVRKSAAWALSEMRLGDEVTSALAATLARDNSADVREMAAWGIASSNSRDALAALSAALRRDRDPEVRATAAWAIGGHGNESDLELLIPALGDSASNVRMMAAWAIGQSAPDHAPEALVALLNDRDGSVREMAAWTLSQIHDPETATPIAAALEKETSHQTRMLELRALMFMDAVSPAMIDKLLASQDSDIRRRAVQILAGHKSGWPWPWPWPRPRPSP